MKRKLLALVLACGVLASTNLGAGAKQLDGVLNLNTATQEELTLLPGIGVKKAEAIIAFRQQHPFKSPEELAEVKGIGPKMIERLAKHLAVQGPTTLHEVSGQQVSKAPPVQ